MNGNCHFVFGAALGTALAMNVETISSVLGNVTATPETSTLLVLGGLIGGIFPDIDNPNSYVGKLSAPISTALGKIGKAMEKTDNKDVAAAAPRAAHDAPQLRAAGGKNHRGIMHDTAVYITGLILCYLHFPPLVGFFAGCLSHLFLDMFNPMGVPFLFGTLHLHSGKIPSGSKSSIIFTWVNVVMVLTAGICLNIFMKKYA